MKVYLDDKRLDWAGLPTKLQHAFAGMTLAFTAAAKLREGSELPLAWFEMAIAAAVTGTFFFELRSLRGSGRGPDVHPKVGWFDLAAGALLIFEAVHAAHHKPFFLKPQFLAGTVAIVAGLAHRKLHHLRQHRRHLTLTEEGVEARLGQFRRFHVARKDLASLELTASNATYVTSSGARHSLNLARYRNVEELRRAIEQHGREQRLLAQPDAAASATA